MTDFYLCAAIIKNLHVTRNSLLFMEPKGSLLSSHEPANGPSMWPDEFTAHPLTNKQTNQPTT